MDNYDISPEKLIYQLQGFRDEFNYPKGKEAINAVKACDILLEFLDTLIDGEQ